MDHRDHPQYGVKSGILGYWRPHLAYLFFNSLSATTSHLGGLQADTCIKPLSLYTSRDHSFHCHTLTSMLLVVSSTKFCSTRRRFLTRNVSDT